MTEDEVRHAHKLLLDRDHLAGTVARINKDPTACAICLTGLDPDEWYPVLLLDGSADVVINHIRSRISAIDAELQNLKVSP